MNGLLSDRTISVQTLLPKDYRHDPAFSRHLAVIRDCGFSGVELNIVDVEAVEPNDLQAFLDEFGLRLTAYASGAAAMAAGLSLSHDDEEERRRAVRACETFLTFASHFDVGVIVGFLKGGPDARCDRLIASLNELAPVAEELNVDLLLEATNRYESGVCNSLADTIAVIDAVGSQRLMLLPDTFHMNIEETDMPGALGLWIDRIRSIHLSDNNRFLPGHGAIDFENLLQGLLTRGFEGTLALEGNLSESFDSDVRLSADYLSNIRQNEALA